MTRTRIPFLLATTLALVVAVSAPAAAQNICTPSPITTVLPMSAVVSLGAHLSGDNQGPYVDGSKQSSVTVDVTGNLIPTASGNVTLRSRYVRINLNSPAGDGAVPRGVVDDARAELHVRYWVEDPTGVRQVHSIQELPDDGVFRYSERTDLLASINGVSHLLMFGGDTWPLNLCRPDLGVMFGAPGTSKVQMARNGDTYMLQLPAGSVGRLFDYSNGFSPVDKGLYYFSFSVTMSPKPKKGK